MVKRKDAELELAKKHFIAMVKEASEKKLSAMKAAESMSVLSTSTLTAAKVIFTILSSTIKRKRGN